MALLSRRTAAAVTFGLAAAVLASLLPVHAQPASARSDYGRITFVDDGDTVDVRIPGNGTQRVRYIGIQAMELDVYSQDLSKLRGECWSVSAATYLHDLAYGRSARISSLHVSSHKGSRLHRSVAVYRGGMWIDTGIRMIRNGLALFDASKTEYLRNLSYMSAAQEAARTGRGMWGHPAHCGEGPTQWANLRVGVNWDAPHNDQSNINGEYISITNTGRTTVSLDGWWVRDNAYRGYNARGFIFPRGTQVVGGKSIFIHPGHGTNTWQQFYWGLDEAIFENVTGSPTYLGDGAYLFDPDGDMRAWKMYPTR